MSEMIYKPWVQDILQVIAVGIAFGFWVFVTRRFMK